MSPARRERGAREARPAGGRAEQVVTLGVLAVLAATPPAPTPASEDGLDVERLARAMRRHRQDATTSAGPHIFSADHCPPYIAAEYAALAIGSQADSEKRAIARELAKEIES